MAFTDFDRLALTLNQLPHLPSMVDDPTSDLVKALHTIRDDTREVAGTPTMGGRSRVWEHPDGRITITHQWVHERNDHAYDMHVVTHTRPGAIIIPRDTQGRVLLGWHYRPAVMEWSLELPRGGCQNGETPTEAAGRELREETGLTLTHPTMLGLVHSDTGLVDDTVHVIQGTTSGRLTGGDGELHATRWWTPNQVRGLVALNVIQCSLTLTALRLADL